MISRPLNGYAFANSVLSNFIVSLVMHSRPLIGYAFATLLINYLLIVVSHNKKGMVDLSPFVRIASMHFVRVHGIA